MAIRTNNQETDESGFALAHHETIDVTLECTLARVLSKHLTDNMRRLQLSLVYVPDTPSTSAPSASAGSATGGKRAAGGCSIPEIQRLRV